MNNELYHYGVKGMKWGIRRYQNADGSLTPAGKKRAQKKAERSEDRKIKSQRKADLKNRRSLSDKDLDAKINRLRKEKQFRELSQEDVAPGRTAVKKFMKTTGGKVLTSAAIGATAYLGKLVVSNALDLKKIKVSDINLDKLGKFAKDKVDWNEAANFIFPNPHKKK